MATHHFRASFAHEWPRVSKGSNSRGGGMAIGHKTSSVLAVFVSMAGSIRSGKVLHFLSMLGPTQGQRQ